MPDISLTNSEHEYLKALIMHNRVDGMSYHQKRLNLADKLLDSEMRQEVVRDEQGLRRAVFGDEIYKGRNDEQ